MDMKKGLLFLFVLLFFASCTLPGISMPEIPQVLNIACVGNFESLEPCGENPPPEKFVRQVFEGLTSFDENLNVVPALAKSWEVADGKIVMHLSDAIFSDGTKLTALDVIKSFECLSKTDQSWIVKNVSGFTLFTQGRSSSILGIEEVDDLTISIKTIDSLEYFLKKLANPRAAIWKQGELPLGTGVFCITKFTPGSKIILVPNPYSKVQPKLTKINFMIRMSHEAAFEDFRQGRVAVAPLDESLVSSAKDESHTLMLSYDSHSFLAVGFNCKNGVTSKVETRLAIASEIDSNDLNQKALQGLHIPIGFANKSEQQINLSKSEINLAIPEGLDENIAHAIALQIKNKTGMKTNVEKMTNDNFVGAILNGKTQMFVFGMMQNTPDDYEMLSLPIANVVLAAGFGYDTANLSTLLKSSNEAVDRQAILAETRMLLEKDVPFIPIIELRSYVVVSDTVKDYLPYAWGGGVLSACSIGR
ncbi:MAG: ABC transporter substrate-binding protein [Caldisericia bacterium]|nr:ABC transporter substrate-binding protein [Caldisericia bacterium]